MWWILGFLVATLIILQLTSFINYARKEVTQSIGDAVLASRIPSGRMVIEEMEQRDIHPFFCFSEYRMIWVEHPSSEETCPWCKGSLIPAS